MIFERRDSRMLDRPLWFWVIGMIAVVTCAVLEARR